MLKIYNTKLETNKIEQIKEFKKGSWISLVNPSESEIQKVCESVKIQEDFIRDALDFEEKARIDYEEDDETTLFVVDVPIIEKNEENDVYTTMPLGMIVVRDDFFITISLRKNKVIEDFEKMKIKNFQTYKKSKLIFQILYLNSSYYLTYLKQINKETEIAEYILKKSMKVSVANFSTLSKNFLVILVWNVHRDRSTSLLNQCLTNSVQNTLHLRRL